MRVAGVIAEYNPFHNGHKYQLDLLKKEYGYDAVVVVMSGDFVQRGAPALTDKFTRARMAIAGGADLVLQMPVAFSTASAEYFAQCGVRLLSELGIVNTLCFGAETPDLTLLSQTADVLLDEPQSYRQDLERYLKKGDSYPKAREKALKRLKPWAVGDVQTQSAISKEKTKKTHAAWNHISWEANNILAIEYVKAHKKIGTTMEILPIQRLGAYHDETFLQNGLEHNCNGNESANEAPKEKDESPAAGQNFASASAIRKALFDGVDLRQKEQVWMPQTSVYELYADDGRPLFLTEEDFFTLLKYRLLLLEREGKSLDCYWDCPEQLADRINNKFHDARSYAQLMELLKTKNYTYTRIARALTHILLGIRTPEFAVTMNLSDDTLYGRVLGFSEYGQGLIRRASKEGTLPLVTKTANAKKILNMSQYELFLQDIAASEVYRSVFEAKTGVNYTDDYRQNPLTNHSKFI